MKKKVVMKLLAGILVAAMCVTQVPVRNLGDVQEVVYAKETSIDIQDASFTGDLWADKNWKVNPSTWDDAEFKYYKYSDDAWLTPLDGSESGFKFWMKDGGTVKLTQAVSSLKAGTYKISSKVMGKEASVSVKLGEQVGTAVSLTGYNAWDSVEGTFTLTEDVESIDIGFDVAVNADGYGYIDYISLSKVEEDSQEKNKATLYYYYEGSEKLYMNIWNHAGIEFDDSAVTDWTFSWANKQAELQKVEGYDNWYSVDYVVSGNTADGFTIYEGNSETECVKYDDQWNNTADYGVLVGGTSKEYAIKEGKLYKSLEEATASLTKKDLEKLISTIPSDYKTMGFVEGGVSAVEAALKEADEVLKNAAASTEDIETAYNNLAAAMDKLSLSAELFVKKVDNYDTNSIRGMDVSSYVSVMESFEKVKELKRAAGVSEDEIAKIGFKDWNGNVLDEQGFFNFLAKEGVNYIRVKVWNNPTDADGKSYGGGHSDLETAVKIGKYATKANMKLLIDFHLSDFWTDPGKQKAPKAWENYTVAQKAEAVNKYIDSSLNTLIKENGVNVGMVQVGNETNGAVCGVTEWDEICQIFEAGCKAVHQYDGVLAALHFTDPKDKSASFAKELSDHKVNYDVYATSYYPNIHGSMEALTYALTTIAKTYDKYVMVAETSWAYTNLNGDGYGDNAYNKGFDVDYNVTVQGQATEVRDVISAVNDVDVKLSNGDKAALGFFYWEPTWIPVQNLYNADGSKKDNYDELLEQNKKIWEECGSGWASSFAAEYDPDDAGMWYGGTTMDNLSVFDFDGAPLNSIKVYNPNYLKYGASTKLVADDYRADDILLIVGEKLSDKLPKITVVYNDSSRVEKEVDWNTEKVEEISKLASTTDGLGTYTLTGTLKENSAFKVETTVVVEGVNLLSDPGFEKGSDSSWTVTGDGATIQDDKDRKSGEKALHFWYGDDFEFSADTKVKVEKAGEYEAYINMQGLSSAGSREGEELVLVATTADGTEYTSEPVKLAGYLGWQKVTVKGIKVTQQMISAGKDEITLSVKAKLNGGAWGTMDDASLYFKKEISSDNSGTTGGGSYGGGSSSGSTINKPSNTTTPADKNVEPTTETAEDGSKTQTVKETQKNAAGNNVAKETVTKTDANGNVQSIVEKSTILNAEGKPLAVVTVNKDGAGKVVTAVANVTENVSGKTATFAADVVSQIQEAAGQKSVMITVEVQNNSGKELFTVTADAKNLTAGKKLFAVMRKAQATTKSFSVYALAAASSDYVLVNSKTYTVGEDGSIAVSMSTKGDYELITSSDLKKIANKILDTVKLKKTSVSIKKGKTAKVALSSKLDMNNVKKVTYSTSKKAVAKVSKDGKVTAKKKGTATIKAKVTLKNGKSKVVSMKVKVK